jgi:hypothetical protein
MQFSQRFSSPLGRLLYRWAHSALALSVRTIDTACSSTLR